MKKYLLFIFLINFKIFSQSLGGPTLREFKENFSYSDLTDSIRGLIVSDKSTKLIKNLDAKIEDYVVIFEKNDTIIIDTSLNIKKYYKLNYLRKDNFELIPFSNTGHTYNNLSYRNDLKLIPEFGFKAKNFNYLREEDVGYYSVPTPFTELMYRSAFQQGQLLDALFSVNTTPEFNFTIARKGLRSLGNYQHFLSSSNNFRFTTNYNSKNKKYILRTHYVDQELFSEENGGIKNEDIINFETGDNEFIDRSVFDPQFENADNVLQGKRFFMDQRYILDSFKDSLTNKELSLGSKISFHKKYYQFKQSSPNTYFGETTNFQSINDKSKFKTFNTELYAIYNSSKIGKINLNINYDKLNYSYINLLDTDQNILREETKSSLFSMGFNYSKSFNNIDYGVLAQSIISGNRKGNLIETNLKINNYNGSFFEIILKHNSRAPDYNFLLLQSEYLSYNWDNDFKNIIANQLIFSFKKRNLFNVNVIFSNTLNHTYFTKNNQDIVYATQFDQKFKSLKLNVSKEFNFKNFSIDNQIQYQSVNNADGIVNVPDIISRNTIYYHKELFNKALYLQTGVSLKYFSKFYMNSYDPLLSEFYVQNSKNIGDFPIIDFFVNAKIQQTRIYFKAEHINSSMTGYNYYSAPNYPYRDFSIRFGLIWNFFL